MNLVLYYNFIGFMILHLLKKVFNEKRRFNFFYLSKILLKFQPFKNHLKLPTFQKSFKTFKTSNLQNSL